MDIVELLREARAGVSDYDNGLGTPVSQEQAIFERFSTGELNSGRPGLGLGLSICCALVEAHGGTICASPSPGRKAGIKFTVAVKYPPASLVQIANCGGNR